MFLTPPQQLDIHTDPKMVVYSMAIPNSGLEIRDHTWLKIPIPMSFLGSSLVDWILNRVDGIKDRKDARKSVLSFFILKFFLLRYASDLLRRRLISHV